MTHEGEEWQGRTGDAWAAHWRLTDRAFGPLTEQLLARSRRFEFSQALDVGCGAGELTLALARGRPQIHAVGLDISGALIGAARERGAHLPNARFEVGDASEWQPPVELHPDLVASRHGVMFFADPAAAFAHLAEIAASRAGLLFSCFRARAENPFFSEIDRLLPQPQSGNGAGPGPFAFADRQYVQDLLYRGGWTDIAFEPFDFMMVAGAGADPIADAIEYFTHIGPAARLLRTLKGAERERCLQRIAELCERNRYETIVSLRAGAWIVTGRRA